MKYFSIERGLILILLSAVCVLAACAGTQTNAPANHGQVTVTVAKDGSQPPTDAGAAATSAFPPIRAGLAAAEFELLDGAKIKLADKKGKVLLVNIWGIWCGPCRAEMPHLVEIQDKYRGE